MSMAAAWKNAERRVAKFLGIKRVGHLGGADCEGSWLVVEVKYRKALPRDRKQALGQARKHAKPGQLAMAVWLERGMRIQDAHADLRLGDLVELLHIDRQPNELLAELLAQAEAGDASAGEMLRVFAPNLVE